MTLNYLLLNLNSINETLLSVFYSSTYDCVGLYTDLVLSGCVVILKMFHWGLLYDFSVCATDMCITNFYLLTYIVAALRQVPNSCTVWWQWHLSELFAPRSQIRRPTCYTTTPPLHTPFCLRRRSYAIWGRDHYKRI